MVTDSAQLAAELEPHLPMNKVGRSINGINDPGGLIRQDTRFTCSHRLLPYKPATHAHTHVHTVIKIKTDRNSLFFHLSFVNDQQSEGGGAWRGGGA